MRRTTPPHTSGRWLRAQKETRRLISALVVVSTLALSWLTTLFLVVAFAELIVAVLEVAHKVDELTEAMKKTYRLEEKALA